METNVNFLLTLCKNKAFQSADVHTAFITDNEKDLFPEQRILEDVIIETAIATVSLLIVFIITKILNNILYRF